MPRLLRRLGAACALLLLVAIACRDHGITGPGLPRHTRIAITPRFQVGTEGAPEVTRIRATVRRVDDENVPIEEGTLLEKTEDVDSEDRTWKVELDLVTSAPERVIVELELIHMVQTSETLEESVEWAARTDAFTLTPGRTHEETILRLGRGPLANLGVQSINVGEFQQVLNIGDVAPMFVTLSPQIGGARPFFGALDPSVATVDEDGRMHALAAGTARITANAGFASDTITITVVDPVTTVSFLGVEAGQSQTAPVGTAVPIAPSVRAFDSGERALRGVPLTFTVTSGGGAIIGATTITTDASGVATLGGWTLGQVAGSNVITVTVAGHPNISTTIVATGVAGAAANIVVVSGSAQSGNAGTVLAQPLVARVRDQFNNPVAGVRVNFATTGGGTFSATADTSDAQGLVSVTWTPGVNGTAQTATATAVGIATPATFTATVTLPPPQVQLALANADKVSLNHDQLVNVTLPTPAPTGGATVTIASSAPSVLSLPAGTTVTFLAGQTNGAITVRGLVEGNATLTATSPQYQTGTLATSVELRVIGIPTTINVPFGQTASLPINIPRPAPAGGITITLTSSDPTKVGLASATAFIPAGGTTGTVTLNGTLPGPSTIIASHPLYDPDTTAATTTAALDILNTTYQINTSFGQVTQVRFLSNNVPVPAPAPGVVVSFVSLTPSCVTVEPTSTIQTGLTESSFAFNYNPQGGTQTFPCTSRIIATSSQAGIKPDTTLVTVAGQPGISVQSASVGVGLQRAFSAVLGASNHGGTTVYIFADDARLLISASPNTPGQTSVGFPVINGQTQVNFYVQALDDAPLGAHALNVSSPLFTTATPTVTVVTPALDVVAVANNTTSLSANDDFYVRVGIPNGQNQFLNELQDRRAGGSPLIVTATVSDTNVIKLVTPTSTGISGTAQIAPATSNTPTSLSQGGFALKPIGNGTATVTASIPGFVTTSQSSAVAVTVTTPLISASVATVGAGLQRPMNATLGAPAPTGGTTVRIASSDSTTLKVSPNATTPGAAFIDVLIPAGGQSISYYLQGMEGRTGTPTVTISAPGYATARPTMTVVSAALDVVALNTTTTTLTGDDDFYARVGVANANNQFLNELQDVRAGGTPIVVTFTSGTPTVGTLVKSTGVQGGTATATIPVGQSNTPTSVSQGGVALRPLAAGTTRVTGTAPGVITTSTGGVVDVTISQPTQTVSAATVGAGLQRAMSGFLSASAHGGVTVRLTSSDPSKLLLAKDATSAGAATLDIVVPNNQSGYNYYLQGVEGQTGTATVTATTPGFANGSATMTIVPPFLDIVALNTTTTTLTANDDFFARVGVANAQGQFLNELQDVRFGGTPIVITFTTSAPGVAQLVPSSTNGTTATATIPVGQSNTPTSVASGGVALDPLTAGTTTVTMSSPQATPTSSNGSVTVTVSAPTLTFSGISPVGAGLQRGSSVILGAPAPTGGTTVRLTSSQPGVLLLSPNATTAGTSFIDVVVPAGQNSFSFYAHGLESQTGTASILARAPGYADGSAAQPVVVPALDVVSLNTSMVASAADDPFAVRVGVPGSNNQFLNELQERRAGQQPFQVNVTSSNAGVGEIVTSSNRGPNVAVFIAAGQNQTPGTVATGGVAFDPLAPGNTNVSASIPGFIATINGGTVTVNVQAGLVQAAARGLVGTGR